MVSRWLYTEQRSLKETNGLLNANPEVWYARWETLRNGVGSDGTFQWNDTERDHYTQVP